MERPRLGKAWCMFQLSPLSGSFSHRAGWVGSGWDSPFQLSPLSGSFSHKKAAEPLAALGVGFNSLPFRGAFPIGRLCDLLPPWQASFNSLPFRGAFPISSKNQNPLTTPRFQLSPLSGSFSHCDSNSSIETGTSSFNSLPFRGAFPIAYSLTQGFCWGILDLFERSFSGGVFRKVVNLFLRLQTRKP